MANGKRETCQSEGGFRKRGWEWAAAGFPAREQGLRFSIKKTPYMAMTSPTRKMTFVQLTNSAALQQKRLMNKGAQSPTSRSTGRLLDLRFW
ncbi:hypothetical protein FNU79_13650 [Deinococcus detaillensis]|uniref:Uncharacterized protein n=1 Tax=Deinococcus detaillensis TaxID=2592048 RepID=A0A553UQG8_9DEIO|nr:hypothetical protein [Deinococcus detaillensis]TSA82415.1 hypothetical protein FNU79_13650 [Deinococcus detaillensis]